MVLLDAGQPEVESVEMKRQFLVVDAQQVQDGGLDVVYQNSAVKNPF